MADLLRLATVDIRPLRHRDFRLLFSGQLISMLGSQITYVAVPFQVYELTRSPLMVGILGVVELVPVLALSMVGGLIADHGDRRTIVLSTELVFAVLSSLLLLNALQPEPSLGVIYVLAGAQAGLFALQRPALEALTPRLVERPELTAAGAAMFFGMPQALFPAIAENLGGPAVLGLLYSAPAAGALLASATSGWTNHVRRHGLAVVVAASVWGVAIVGFGLAPTPLLALPMLAVAGAAHAVSGIFRQAIWNYAVPDTLRGRLASIEMVSYMSGPALGNTEAGMAAALFGVPFAVVSGGVLCVLGCFTCGAVLEKFRRYEPAPQSSLVASLAPSTSDRNLAQPISG